MTQGYDEDSAAVQLIRKYPKRSAVVSAVAGAVGVETMDLFGFANFIASIWSFF